MTPSLGTCGPGVLDDIKRHGMKVVIDDQLPPELNDMSATLAKVKALKPDLLVVSGHEKGAMTAVTQIKALHVYVPMLALTHCNSAQIAEKLGGSFRGPSHNGRRWLWARAG